MIGCYIFNRRRELKMTQRQLCKRCGLSASFLSDVENGKRDLGVESLTKLAKVLACGCAYEYGDVWADLLTSLATMTEGVP